MREQDIDSLQAAARKFQDFLDIGEDDSFKESELGDTFQKFCTPKLILELIRAYKEPKYSPTA